jgi:hypothetical protein
VLAPQHRTSTAMLPHISETSPFRAGMHDWADAICGHDTQRQRPLGNVVSCCTLLSCSPTTCKSMAGKEQGKHGSDPSQKQGTH